MTVRKAPALVRASESIFDRILVCVDGTKESLEACRQAHELAEPESTVEAAFASLYPPAAASALGVDDLAERLDRAATSSLSAAARIVGPHAELRRLHGFPVDALLDEAERARATLLAIGTHEHRRLEEIVLGGVAGELQHRAPCAVLLARPVPDLATFPREIVVGVDGSQQAELALAVARTIASHRHSRLRRVVASRGKHIDLGPIARRHPRIEFVPAAPVPALVGASACADLLVVGSRGLHGVRALGSVSERVAHGAPCSVLVVR
jgi:nucleotide-binding universal stress UspA family protein